MSVENDEREPVDERYRALIHGLGSKSSTKISSAAYITSRLNGLSEKGEYEFTDGHGVLNETILFDALPNLENLLYEEDFSEHEDMVAVGEFLSQYDDLDLIALALYAEEGEDVFGWHKSKLEENFDDVESDIESIRERLSRSE